MRNILFIRLSAVGDVINTLPALSLTRKRYPDAKIGFIVEDRAKDLIIGHPDVDRVFVFERKRWSRAARRPGSFFRALREVIRYVRSIRRERFQIALDIQGNIKGTVHTLLSGARRRIGFARGYCQDLNYLFSTIRITPPHPLPRAEKFAALLRPLGVSVLNGSPSRLPYSQKSADRVARFLSDRFGNKPFLALHPGTSESGKEKRWPLERYAETGKKAADEFGLGVLVTWGPGELDLARQLCALMDDGGTLSIETTSLLDMAEILKRARIFVSADTGPMHLAAACGTPCVAIFGPKDPAIYRPYGSIHHVLKKSDRTEDVSVPDVLDAIRSRLKGRASR